MEDYQIHRLIDEILPPQSDKYHLDEINTVMQRHYDRVEIELRKNNDQFDEALDQNTVNHLQSLNGQISKLQLAILKIQCDISYAKEQHYVVESIKDNSIIQDRIKMSNEERELRQSLRQLKFKPIVDFFNLYTMHLETSIRDSKKLCSQQTSIFIHQLFDWTQYQRSLLLLRACGRAQMDIDKFERLYSSDLDIISMLFRQPLDTIHFNNFIEFYDTFSLETQLDISTAKQGKNETIDHLLKSLSLSEKPIEYNLLNSIVVRLRAATVECCKLLVDINMSYIEAHLTDGINIDKLNGTENASIASQEDSSLPIYALSPREYITQIGQHLLTLRKQTEQFDIGEDESLKFGLESLRQAQDIPIDVHRYETVTEIVMRCISRHCIRSLLGRTNNSILSKLTLRGRRQLATDALYLDNVLEDLRLLDPSEPNISKFKSLLSQ